MSDPATNLLDDMNIFNQAHDSKIGYEELNWIPPVGWSWHIATASKHQKSISYANDPCHWLLRDFIILIADEIKQVVFIIREPQTIPEVDQEKGGNRFAPRWYNL